MAVCESQLESGLSRLNREGSDDTSQERTLPAGLPLTVDYRSPVSHFVPPAVELYAARHKQEQVSSAESSETATPIKRKRGRPRVDKTSPEYLANLAARKQAREMAAMARGPAPDAAPGGKRKRGRPRVDKTSPEYLARKRARELEALERKAKREYKRRSTAAKSITTTKPTINKQQNSTNNKSLPNNKQQILANKQSLANNKQQSLANNRNLASNKNSASNKTSANNKNSASNISLGNKRPQSRVTKRLPPVKTKVAARKLPQKSGKVAPVRKMAAKNVVVRRNSKFSKVKRKDSGASSSTGDTTPRVKRKYTKRTPSAKKNDGQNPATERVKGKRGRPRKVDQMNANRQQPKIRVRNNLMPMNNEPISLDSDDEPDLGSPSAASDSLSLDENLRALRHIHEKYANIDKDELYEAHLLAANFKKPPADGVQRAADDDVLSVRSSEGGASVKELDTRVEKLEDSSNSDSDSSTSGSGSSSSGSSSSSSSCSSDSSDTSDSESEGGGGAPARPAPENHVDQHSTYSAPAWAATFPEPAGSESGSDSDPERVGGAPPAGAGSHDEISESDNESPDKSFQCHICRKWYSTRVTLKIHRRSHQNRGGGATRQRQRSSDRYECDICNETFPRREKLYAHKAEAHRGAMTFRCEVCRRCFEHDDELAAHAAHHTHDERNGRCSECGATFPRYEQLRRHRACAHPAASPLGSPAGSPAGGAGGAGGGMPHACAHCGKRFSHVHSLTRHLHNHAKQLYRCVVCKASFARADQLAQHLNSHLANYKRLKP